MENARVLLATGETLWVDPKGFQTIGRAFAAGNAGGRYIKLMVAETETAPPTKETHLNVDQIVYVRKPTSAAEPAAGVGIRLAHSDET